jgi:endonuclease III
MSKPTREEILNTLLQQHGQTFAAEIGIPIQDETPSALFQLLCSTILFSTRISVRLATSAAQALAQQGWTTPQAMVDASWEDRARVLNESGYARYDERTASMLGDTAQFLLERYEGDVRRLREEAERQPKQERALLKECKGLGDVGVDIFFREAQGVWDELYPFADKRARAGAESLGLPTDAAELAKLVEKDDFPRLVAALVRVELENDAENVREAAR